MTYLCRHLLLRPSKQHVPPAELSKGRLSLGVLKLFLSAARNSPRNADRTSRITSPFLLLLALLLFGCESNIGEMPLSKRPTLIYVVSSGNSDLRSYPKLNEIISKHYDYQIRRLSGYFDRSLAERKFQQGRRNPRWDRSIDFWEYLMRRDPLGRLSKSDVEFLKKYEVGQVPSALVVYRDGHSQIFEAGMSMELFGGILSERRKCRERVDCTVQKGELASVLSGFWKIEREDDRRELEEWLRNRLLR